MSEIGDGLDHLRIPFEKIKFGEKLEGHGYGSVFEGEFDDRRVALKQLNITNLGNIKPKLLAEILTISRFRQHPNLVALLGFCDEKNNEIILVYEFVGSGNLAEKMRKRLTTIQRLEICLGAARGLDYLHTGVDSTTTCIVHGNIKLSKILLNTDLNSSKLEAKVSSFGLSKIVPGQAQRTLESTDPADEATEKATKESDVYSFGVLLLEVLCGVSELVDTDDYQERHVTELVPKRLEQNKLRKIVHFDIRKEIRSESLETYAKIACQCVIENPQARPTMTQVVEELEKALRLQGGEVSYVQIPGIGIRTNENTHDEKVIEDGPKEDGSRVIDDSNILEKEPADAKNVIVDEDAKDVTANDKLDVVGEGNGDEISDFYTTSQSTNDDKNAEDIVAIQEPNIPVPTLDNDETLPDRTNIKDDQNEDSNTLVLSTDDQETTDEHIHVLNSEEESKMVGQNEDNHQINNKAIAALESSNGDTNTFAHPEPQDTGILESNSRDYDNLPCKNYDDEIGNDLQHLRIPFEKIKIGKKIDVHGYGSMFEGEYDHRQVALKRLNITNIRNIKPMLLAEILAVSRYRQHPNLVALLGFCDEKSDEIIIVYEYASSGHLEDKMSKHLTTIQRLEICLGAARGLDYLHTGVDSYPGIIHGDIKLSKILLNLDSTSSKLVAKVSSFGLSKILPGQAQTTPDPTDNGNEVKGKATKESDVYSFGVLLLEVLCGVPELVDTDDYQERHVTELVPKRLQQNLLRKIVHFDIRDEITTESLETYAKIACKCVMKNSEERPTMAEVVAELEKALRFQHGEVSDVHILDSNESNGNGLPEETIKHEDDEIIGMNTTEKESQVTEEPIDDTATQVPIPVSVSEDSESAPDTTHVNGAEEEIGDHRNNLKSTDKITMDPEVSDEQKIIGENEVDNESKITTTGPDFCNGDSAMSFPIPVSGGEDNKIVEERTEPEEVNTVTMDTDGNKTKEEIMDDKTTVLEITKDHAILDSSIIEKENTNSASSNSQHANKNPDSTVSVTGREFDGLAKSTPVRKPLESKSKRSNSTCSESSNGDDSAPSDYLLHKSPPANGATLKKPSNNSRTCCSCSWWRFFADRVVSLGGQSWNKLVSCFTCCGGQFSSKHD